MTPTVFGIGNPLIDVVIQATDDDLAALSVEKGIMHLVTRERQQEILDHFADATPTFRPGGSAPNTMIACAGLGATAVVSGKIGNDEFGRTYERQVQEFGVISRLVRGTTMADGTPGMTGSSIILVTPDGERTMNTHLGFCRDFAASDVDDELLAASRFFYFTGYMWDTESQKAAIRHAMDVARHAGVQIVFDLADPFAVDRYRDDFLMLLRDSVDIAFANRKELSILFDDNDVQANAMRLGEMVAIAAVKVGKQGSYAVEAAGPSTRDGGAPTVTLVPGRPIVATDSTGAGDMYAAGFITALSRGATPVEAARLGGHLAEEVIQVTGAQLSVEQMARIRAEL